MPFHSFTALKMPNYGKFSALSNSTSAKSFFSHRSGFGKWFLRECRIKKRAEPAFTSAKVRHASKSCSRGRFFAISYMLKNSAKRRRGLMRPLCGIQRDGNRKSQGAHARSRSGRVCRRQRTVPLCEFPRSVVLTFSLVRSTLKGNQGAKRYLDCGRAY